ncbi:MAG: heavy metal-responsive transcriptional regulator [Chloroflexi bacterium]|nr:heavy metal-responsive transcriptional regulator [Chloroflexota bacterium]
MIGTLKIGDLARATGLTVKTIRYYELLHLLEEPQRTESGYRLYDQADVESLEFIKQAKQLGLSLSEIRDILVLHEQRQAPCVHVLALLDQKLEQIDSIMRELDQFQRELKRLRAESQVRLEQLPEGARICGIIERGIHAKGEVALAWLEGRRKGR